MKYDHISALKIGDTTIHDNIVVLLYSGSQQAFHVESFIEHLQTNMIAFMADKPTDYTVIGIFESRELCDKVFHGVASFRDARQQTKDFVETILKSLEI